jgi:integrase
VEADLPPVPPKSQLVLNRFQLEDLAEAIGTRVARHRALVYTLGYAGLRIGEASALIRDRIDLGRCEIHVLQSRKRDGSVGDTKTHQRRTVVIPPALRDRLAVHLTTFVEPRPDALVFTAAGRADQGWAHAGAPLNPQNFQQRIFTQGLVDAGLDQLGATLPTPRQLTPHDLRDTCATLPIEGGADLYEVMKYLGHRSIQVTERHYAQLVDERKRRTAAALDEIMRSAAGARVNVVSYPNACSKASQPRWEKRRPPHAAACGSRIELGSRQRRERRCDTRRSSRS